MREVGENLERLFDDHAGGAAIRASDEAYAARIFFKSLVVESERETFFHLSRESVSRAHGVGEDFVEVHDLFAVERIETLRLEFR